MTRTSTLSRSASATSGGPESSPPRHRAVALIVTGAVALAVVGGTTYVLLRGDAAPPPQAPTLTQFDRSGDGASSVDFARRHGHTGQPAAITTSAASTADLPHGVLPAASLR
jgi:hypothetical protein